MGLKIRAWGVCNGLALLVGVPRKTYLYAMTVWGLSNRAFWDVDFNQIDFEKHGRFVIERAFNQGTWKDQVAVMNYYGLERLRTEVVKIPCLRPTVVSFLGALLGIPKNDFLCCKPKPLPQLHWDY
jgi:hypothetical protein